MSVGSLVRRTMVSFYRSARNFNPDCVSSYSQEGEDMVLRRVFNNKRGGFFVDVGAHHPRMYSNTYYFYLRDWRGINIDAMPGGMAAFDRMRPGDINVEA